MKNDTISRRAAIKAIDDLPNCYNGYSDTYDKAYIIGVLEELPTIDVPERKVGKWNGVYVRCEKTILAPPSIRSFELPCDGCKFVSTKDTDFPCSVCVRREKDYYEQE